MEFTLRRRSQGLQVTGTAVQQVTAGDVEDLPDVRIPSVYDSLAGVEKIERDRMLLAEGKVYWTGEGGGDRARRAEITVLQP